MSSKRADSGVKNDSKVGKKNQAKPDKPSSEKQQNEKPTETQDKSLTEEKLNAAIEKLEKKDKIIMELEKCIKDLTYELKDHSSLSSEQEKTMKSLKDAQTEWQYKYREVVNEKDEAYCHLEMMRHKMNQQEADAKNLSKSSEEMLMEKEKEICKVKTIVKNQSAELQQTVQRNKSDISKLNEEITTLRKERDGLNKNIKDMEKMLQTTRESKDAGLNERNEKLSTELINVKRKELEKENVRLQNHCVELIEKLKRKEEENRKMEAELKSIVEEKNKLMKEKSAKENDGANEIPYLSDTIRPTKLSERFLEIYNNEWQDVFIEFESEYYETEIIIKLYQLILQIYKFCQTLASNHENSIQSTLMSMPLAYGRSMQSEIDKTSARQLKEIRRNIAPCLVNDVVQHFYKTEKFDLTGGRKLNTFVRKCVEICWLMNVQVPPVVLDTSVSKVFDENRFQAHTISGKTVDFVVWPPVLLHKDGPLLCKGVAQGK